MGKYKKRIDPLILVLSAIAAILAVILAMLFLQDAKEDDELDKTLPTSGITVPLGSIQEGESEQDTQPLGSEDVPEVTEAPGETGTSMQNPEETEPEGTKDNPQKNTEPEGTKDNPQENTEPEETKDNSGNNTEQVIDGTAVNTPHCVLRIPEEWVGNISVQITEEAWNTAVAFYGTLNGEKILLYTIHFGGAAGEPVGTWLTDENVLMDMTLEVHDITENSAWSTEERDAVYAMQESLNYVLKGLEDYREYTPLHI